MPWPAWMPAVMNAYVFASQKRKAQKWHGCRLLFQPKPAVWAARALAKLKLGRIAQYLGNHWRYAVPHGSN
jgi:hypothetical protein